MARSRTIVLGTSSYDTDHGRVRERTTLVLETGLNPTVVFDYRATDPELSHRTSVSLTPAMAAKLVAALS
jgi:hypothetical protein